VIGNQSLVVVVIISGKIFLLGSSFVTSNALDVALTTGSGQKNAQNMIRDSRKASRGLECNATNEVNLIS
jgi:hypothetical protein